MDFEHFKTDIFWCFVFFFPLIMNQRRNKFQKTSYIRITLHSDTGNQQRMMTVYFTVKLDWNIFPRTSMNSHKDTPTNYRCHLHPLHIDIWKTQSCQCLYLGSTAVREKILLYLSSDRTKERGGRNDILLHTWRHIISYFITFSYSK